MSDRYVGLTGSLPMQFGSRYIISMSKSLPILPLINAKNADFWGIFAFCILSSGFWILSIPAFFTAKCKKNSLFYVFFNFVINILWFSIAPKHRRHKCICSEHVKWGKYETASIIEHSGFYSAEAAMLLFVLFKDKLPT